MTTRRDVTKTLLAATGGAAFATHLPTVARTPSPSRILEELGRDESFTVAVVEPHRATEVREVGSFGGGFAFVKFAAYQNPGLRYPQYEGRFAGGPVFDALSKDWPKDLDHFRPY